MNDSVTSAEQAEQNATQTRAPAPDGMTYNRKGVLVKKRAPQAGRSNRVFLVMQVVDDQGQPTEFGKRNVNIIGVMRNSDKVLELLDGGEYPNAFYIRHDLTAR
jgi:hypothetical protein